MNQMKQIKTSTLNTKKWTLESSFKNEAEILSAVEFAIAEGDAYFLASLLGILAKKHGVADVAQKTGLSRTAIYSTLSPKGNPETATLLRILPALGLRMRIEPIVAAS